MNNKQWVFQNGEWFDTANNLSASSLDEGGWNDSFELILGACGCISDEVADIIYKYLSTRFRPQHTDYGWQRYGRSVR